MEEMEEMEEMDSLPDESESDDDNDEDPAEGDKGNLSRQLAPRSAVVQRAPFFFEADVEKRAEQEYTRKCDEILCVHPCFIHFFSAQSLLQKQANHSQCDCGSV